MNIKNLNIKTPIILFIIAATIVLSKLFIIREIFHTGGNQGANISGIIDIIASALVAIGLYLIYRSYKASNRNG